jgi:hypothetical protein
MADSGPIFRNVFQEQDRPKSHLEEPNPDARGEFAMSWNNSNLKLAMILALALTGPACNNPKAEQVEEEGTTDSLPETNSTQDNRDSQSGDAAFIKIFPDGELVVTRGETVTVSAPGSTEAAEATPPAQETAAPAPAETSATGPEESAIPPSSPAEESSPAPTETASQSAPESEVVVNEPAHDAESSAPETVSDNASADEQLATKDAEDSSRKVLTLNEANAAPIISVQPKANKAIVAIGKHNDFAPGPYMIMAKWTNDSKKVKVNVSNNAKEKNCAIDDSATQDEWKSIGVFYLTKKAKVVITNPKNSRFSVKNELLLKPVIAEHLNAPSKFKCLNGQIKGHGLVTFP